MSTPKRVVPVPARTPRATGNARVPERHAVPLGRSEKHMGATENQVSVTMPPKGDDDEPKQG